ncbi:MAG: hypothetical protein HYT09_03870 [Candidatus Levybacteria bacterium]|nr:hypothetical protein [Candidatus Levybacteria bacterium]
MKIQDIAFLIIIAILFSTRKPRLFVIAGISSLFLAIPLFQQWIFFTAQRLTWYAFAFFLIALILNIVSLRKK